MNLPNVTINLIGAVRFAGDFDEDGDDDVFVGELTGQGADLYVNDGTGVFVEGSAQAGIRLRTLPHTTFGAA